MSVHHFVSGIKAPPTSAFTEDECSTQEDLVKMCFSPAPSAVASSSSSHSSGESNTGSIDVNLDRGRLPDNFNVSAVTDVQASDHGTPADNGNLHGVAVDVQTVVTPLVQSELCAQSLNSPICFKRSNSSRQGRSNQRWETCSKSGRLIRLVTGSVPITRDGSILFVSAAKKREWILPKGGWECDETLEEGCLRETFEEAGVIGTLGPKLTEVVYETRKGRKRRIAEMNEEMKRLQRQDRVGGLLLDVAGKQSSVTSSEDEGMVSDQVESSRSTADRTVVEHGSSFAVKDAVEKEVKERNASLCKMQLFPLYVSKVFEDWPESGRARKVLPIDEAIKMTTRPEIKLVLEEIKERGLDRPEMDVAGNYNEVDTCDYST